MASRSGQRFEEAWAALPAPFRRCLQLAYTSLRRGGLPVGSVITDTREAIVAEGRNHAYDPPGGDEILQGTPLAHAELNALARIPTERGLGDCTLWSTQRPCAMCAAAIEFTGLGRVRFLADDPAFAGTAAAGSGPTDWHPEPVADEWVVAANVLFLHRVILARGLRSEMVLRNQQFEPETAGLAVRLVEEDTLTVDARGLPLEDVLARRLWKPIVDAADARRDRRDRRDRRASEPGAQ